MNILIRRSLVTFILMLFGLMTFSQPGPGSYPRLNHEKTFDSRNAKELPAPTDLSATFNANNVELTWEAPVIENFFESFEGSEYPPEGWLKMNFDEGSGWDRVEVGTSPIPGWSYGSIIECPNGGQFQAFATWLTGGDPESDQWLVSPSITVLEGDVLKFWLRSIIDFEMDYVEVRLSSTVQNDTSAFSIIIDQFLFPIGSSTEWQEFSYTLTDFVEPGTDIYLAFREKVADNYNSGAVSMDNIQVERNTNLSKSLTGYNIYYAQDNQNFELLDFTNDTHYTHNDILPGEHCYYVTAVFDPEGESDSSNTACTEGSMGAGGLDLTFGNQGIAMYDLSADLHETIWDMEILQDSTILAIGNINVGSVTVTDGFLLSINQDGSINESWGYNGLVTFDFGESTYPYKVEVLVDGSILVSGTAVGLNYNSEFFVAKFNADGTPNPDFGDDGVYISNHSNNDDECYSMLVQDDEKIVFAGKTGYGSDSKMLFLRLNPDGFPDIEFGEEGFAEVDASIQSQMIKGVEALSDGSIIGVGYSYQSDPYYTELATVVKLTGDGNLETGFGNQGILIPDWVANSSEINDVEIKNDSIYITGLILLSDYNIFLAKYDASGNIDASFGSDGVSVFDNDILDNAFDLYIGPDQKLYICGNTGLYGPGAAKDFLLLRYLSNGGIDTSFNGTGFTTTQIRIDSDAAFSVKMQADGKIVLAGMSSGFSTTQLNNVALVRYLNDFVPFGAGFMASETEICEGHSVVFTDLSMGVINAWEWYFEGGDPETATDQNPTVQYEFAGVYDVKLVISNSVSTDTLLLEDYIYVDECVGIDEQGVHDGFTYVYPNPATNIVNISMNGNYSDATVVVYNTMGHDIINEMFNGQIEINISSLEAGIYFVKINTETMNEMKKLIIK